MKKGDRVIVVHTPAFTTRRVPRLATFLAYSSEGQVIVKVDDDDYPVYAHGAHVRLYSDALWQAWQQWQQNAKLLDEQQQSLIGGRVPKALVESKLF